MYKSRMVAWLGSIKYEEVTDNWKYFHELDGVVNFFKHLAVNNLPFINLVNMQGFEAKNADMMRQSDRLCHGLDPNGIPTGKLGKVFVRSIILHLFCIFM